MHFVLSYDLSLQGEQRTQVENQIQTIISPYRHVRCLTTFYIVHIDDRVAWQNILNLLSELSRQNQGQLLFVMSPIMHGGRYNGMLQTGGWDAINELTNLDAQ